MNVIFSYIKKDIFFKILYYRTIVLTQLRAHVEDKIFIFKYNLGRTSEELYRLPFKINSPILLPVQNACFSESFVCNSITIKIFISQLNWEDHSRFCGKQFSGRGFIQMRMGRNAWQFRKTTFLSILSTLQKLSRIENLN